MVKKIWVFSDKDFLDWPRPLPLLTDSKKKDFFMPPLRKPGSQSKISKNIYVPADCGDLTSCLRRQVLRPETVVRSCNFRLQFNPMSMSGSTQASCCWLHLGLISMSMSMFDVNVFKLRSQCLEKKTMHRWVAHDSEKLQKDFFSLWSWSVFFFSFKSL